MIATAASTDDYVPVIRREDDAALANSISNMPEVRPAISTVEGPVDWTPIVHVGVILSNGEDAVMVLEQTARRIWEVITIFAPSCRGKRALATGRAMRDWMMPRYADVILGPVPNGLPAARWFYRQMGGKPVIADDGAQQFMLVAA